jgi:hypothetical protein
MSDWTAQLVVDLSSGPATRGVDGTCAPSIETLDAAAIDEPGDRYLGYSCPDSIQ